jgi:hypothetical protein
MNHHVTENPCLLLSWKELWPLLQLEGWRKIDLSTAKLHKVGSPITSKIALAYKPNDLPSLEPGIHIFVSKSAMLRYISRFPYLLQERKVLVRTLLRLKWIRSNNGMFQCPGSSVL